MGRIGTQQSVVAAEDRAELTRLLTDLLDPDWLSRHAAAAHDALYARICALSPDAAWSDYVFHSDAFVGPDGETDIAAVVARMTGPQSVIFGAPPSEA